MAQLNHIALYVADLKRSAAFYRDVIGAEIIDDPFRDERHIWFKIGEHNQLHLIAASQSPKPGNSHFAFSVASLDDFVGNSTAYAIEYEDGRAAE